MKQSWIPGETFDLSFWVITKVYFEAIAEISEISFPKGALRQRLFL